MQCHEKVGDTMPGRVHSLLIQQILLETVLTENLQSLNKILDPFLVVLCRITVYSVEKILTNCYVKSPLL